MTKAKELSLIFLLYCLVFSIYFFPVLTHLNTYIYGLIGDNFWWFIWGWWSKNYQSIGIGSLHQNPLYGIGGFEHMFWNSTHPLGWGVASEMIRLLPTNLAYNLLMLPTFPLAAFFAYILFNYLTKNRYISFAFGLLFSFSPYHLFSSQRHTELAITWVIPLVIWTFLKAFERRKLRYILLASFSLALTMLSSIYWGSYLGLFTICLILSVLVLRPLFGCFRKGVKNSEKRDNSVSSLIKIYGIYIFFFILMIIPFLFPYIKANYLQDQDTTRGWVYQNTTVVKRGLSDFMLYSIMPYHFFIPLSENPITGEIGKKFVSFVQENWNYFLAKNYVFSEHGGDFLGWINSLLFIYVLYYALKKVLSKFRSRKLGVSIGKLSKDKAEEDRAVLIILIFALTGLFIYLFAMPPYFTISGFKIYTPSYLVYMFLPMLRTISRMGVLVFMCILIVNAVFLSHRIRFGSNKLSNYLFLLVFTLMTLAEFYMPLRYLNDSVAPPAYAYIGTKSDLVYVDYVNDKGKEYKYTGPSFVAEYPWGYDIAAFYQKYHKKGFANPLFYANPYLDFNGIEFSYELDSEGGLKKAYDLGIRYILYHKGDEDTIKRVQRGEDPEGFFKSHSKSYQDFGETIVFEL